MTIRLMHTSMGPMARLGTAPIRGRFRALACGCYAHGNLALVAVDADAQVWGKLTVNLHPWPATWWSVLINHDVPDAMQALEDAEGLVVLPTGRTFDSGWVTLPEAVVLPPAWRRDDVGDLHADSSEAQLDVEHVGEGWAAFIQGQQVHDLPLREHAWEAAVALLERARDMRKAEGLCVPHDALGYPQPPGAPCPQLGLDAGTGWPPSGAWERLLDRDDVELVEL